MAQFAFVSFFDMLCQIKITKRPLIKMFHCVEKICRKRPSCAFSIANGCILFMWIIERNGDNIPYNFLIFITIWNKPHATVIHAKDFSAHDGWTAG